jgi:hypothetical protein
MTSLKILRFRKEKPVETLLWLRKPITENQSKPLNALKVVKILDPNIESFDPRPISLV